MRSSRYILIFGISVLSVALAITHGAQAGAECASLGGGCDTSDGWDPMQKLEEIGKTEASQGQAGATKWPEKSRVVRWNQSAYGFGEGNVSGGGSSDPSLEVSALDERSGASGGMLAWIDSISEADVLLDVSENSTRHIEGSVVIPYMNFSSVPGVPRSAEEISEILGAAGISRSDSVVVYGECLPCGGGPSPATYVYWILRSLGHEDVRVLDGSLEDYVAAGGSTSTEPASRRPATYAPQVNEELSATYEYVKSGVPQIVDARTLQEFGKGSIPGAINIPYGSVLDGDRIKDGGDLEKVFATLSRDRPVVVYSNTGLKASVVWFALEMLGFDARLYSYENWLYNQAALGSETSEEGSA
ncbi:MAG: rhodanese-like domain-containing protein [Methanothrix sp.]|nr:rhodanese-like domain-containing protein [Methanothrix sp.]